MRHERGWQEKIAARTARRLQANLRRAAEAEGKTSMADEATNAAGPAHLAPQPAPGLAFDARGVLSPLARESVADALLIVESYGPWGADLNDAHRRQIVLADEVKRLVDKCNGYIADNARLAEQVENMRAALQWYADGLHFDKASPDAWDTVSGEPPNWWCDEAGTATVEDGSIAAMVLRGELTGAQVQALE